MQLIDSSIFDNTLQSVLILDDLFHFTYANSSFSNLVDVPLPRLKQGRPVADLLPNLDGEIKTLATKISVIQEVAFEITKGERKQVQVCVEQIDFQSRKQFLFYFQDVSLENRLQSKYRSELQQKEEFIGKLDRKLFELSFLLDISSVLHKNSDAKEVFGEIAKLISAKMSFANLAIIGLEDTGPKMVAQVGEFSLELVKKIILEKPPEYLRVEAFSSKSLKGVLIIKTEKVLADEDRNLLQAITSHIVSRLEQEVLYSSSITDAKTGLFNSRFFQASLLKEIDQAQRTNTSFGVIVIDIDHFKKFNDTYGHQTGDEVLVFVAEQIKESVRNADVAARFGGEEFCIIAVNTNVEGMMVVMERIRTAIETKGFKSATHGKLKLTVSLGGALFPTHGKVAEELFARADEALYVSKNSGRNKSTISSAKI